MNPNPRTDHLKPYQFTPGNNAAVGRRTPQPLTRTLQLVARTRVPEGPKAGRKWLTAMALGLAEAAASGDAAAFREYRNTIQGVPQGDREEPGPPQITINLISVAPQKQAVSDSPEIVVHTEAIGKTN